jgi:DNA polymerase V
MITGESPDVNRYYELFKQIEDFNKTLEECKNSLDGIAADMKEMSGSKSTQSIAAIEKKQKEVQSQLSNLNQELVDAMLTLELLDADLERKEEEIADAQAYEQMTLFTDYDALQKEREEEKAAMAKERRLQEAMLAVKKRYGKNAILKGMNLQEGATAMERNNQIGGHRA